METVDVKATLPLDELVSLNDRLAFTFRSMGLKDRELDEAIVASLHPALRSLEASTSKTPKDAIEAESCDGLELREFFRSPALTFDAPLPNFGCRGVKRTWRGLVSMSAKRELSVSKGCLRSSIGHS